jgi:murein DD-endopeptidase MepM/ murein hydrolase activator NlpD
MPAGSAVVAAVVAAAVASGALAVAVVAPSAAPPAPPALSVGTSTTSGAAAHGGSDLVPARLARQARYSWPLTPVPQVLRRFAVGPYRWSPGHRGVDLAADAGQGVLAAGPGVVIFAGLVAGMGVVVVDHGGGLRTTYEPVAAGTRVGARTVAGTRLGVLGAWPGHCAASCLHWGAIRAGAYLDPLALLGLVPPVLLPLVAGPSP